MSFTLSLQCQPRWRECLAGITLKNHVLTSSSAKLTLRGHRNRLSMESVELVECLHNWLLSGLIEGVLDEMDTEDLMDFDE